MRFCKALCAPQEIGSVEGNPFYCLCSLRKMCFCKALCAPTAAEQIMTMTTMMTMMPPVVRNYVAFRLPVDACFTFIFRKL